MELEIPNLDSPIQRKKLTKALSIFRKLRKISRLRAEKLYARVEGGVKDATIITGQEIDAVEEKYILGLYKKSFPNTQKPTFSINPRLEGGVRMMYGDEMVELTLNQIKI